LPQQPLDLLQLISEVPAHTDELHAESNVPIEHYKRLSNEAWAALRYFRRKVKETRFYQPAWDRHFGSLRRMVVLSLIEAFERFLKELAAACIDQVAYIVADDRLDRVVPRGSAFANHFPAGTLGKALCDSLTWLKTTDINERFRDILADPFERGAFYIFPKQNQKPRALQGLDTTASIIFQLRHILVHNAGVLTESDAVKLRVLGKRTYESPRLISPTDDDLQYVKQFLNEASEKINAAVAERLAELLTKIHEKDPSLVDPAAKATQVAERFGVAVIIANHPPGPA
jgi:hypothetical protein